jgi:hypothetical protein
MKNTDGSARKNNSLFLLKSFKLFAIFIVATHPYLRFGCHPCHVFIMAEIDCLVHF